jgi:hypothetical protein
MDFSIEVDTSPTGKVVRVSTSKDEEQDKTQLHIPPREIVKLTDRLANIHDSMKKFSTYKYCSISYEQVDHYDSDIDTYEVPSFHIVRGKRKVTVGFERTGSLPKGWNRITQVTFINPIQLKCVFKALDNLGVTIGKPLEKVIRKHIKESKNFYHEED